MRENYTNQSNQNPVSPQDEQSIPDYKLERVFVKRLLFDKDFILKTIQFFDSRQHIIENQNLKPIASVIYRYFKVNDTIPSLSIIENTIEQWNITNRLSERYNAEFDSVIKELHDTVSYTEFDEPVRPKDNQETFIDKQLEIYIRRKVLWSCLINSGTSIDDNSKKSLDNLISRIDQLERYSFTSSHKDSGFEYFNEEEQDKHWEYLESPEQKISTGWDNIDEVTNGGFLKGGRSLYLFIGQAGLGKSLFLSNLGVNCLKQNLTVILISLEMSQDVYGTRFDAHITNMDINKLNRSSHECRRLIKKFYSEHNKAKLFIKEFPPRSITTEDIEDYVDSLIESRGIKPDIILVDYLNLLLSSHNTTSASMSMFQNGLIVSEKLRALSYKYMVPVVSAVQANSSGMNNADVGMEHISESRGIAHTADCLFAMFQTEAQREQSIIGLRVVKNRLGGRVGQVLNFIQNAESLRLTAGSAYMNNEDDENSITEFSNDTIDSIDGI